MNNEFIRHMVDNAKRLAGDKDSISGLWVIKHNGKIVERCADQSTALQRLTQLQPKSIWEATRKGGWEVVNEGNAGIDGKKPEGNAGIDKKVNEKAFLIMLNGKQIDKVFYSDDDTPEEVKKSLIDHDGYDHRIEVVEEKVSRAGESTVRGVLTLLKNISEKQIDKFWVVTEPHADSTIEDILFEVDIHDFATQIKGGLDPDEVFGIYDNGEEAKKAAEDFLKDVIEGKVPDDKDPEATKIKKLTEAGIKLPKKVKKILDGVKDPISTEDLLDWSHDELSADDADEYQEEICTYLKSKGMIEESKITEDDKDDEEFEPDSQPKIEQPKDPANPTPADGEEEEQDTVTKEYVGKTEDTHFYMVSTPGQTDETPADMQIVDQEGTQKYSAKEQNLDPADPANFIIQAIQELEIDEITRSVLIKYILPMLEEDDVEEEEEKPEGMEDEIGVEKEAGNKNVEPTKLEKDNESKVNEAKIPKFATVTSDGSRGEVVEDFTDAIKSLFGGYVYDRSKPELTYVVVSKKPLSKSDLKTIDQEEDLDMYNESKVNESKVNETDVSDVEAGSLGYNFYIDGDYEVSVVDTLDRGEEANANCKRIIDNIYKHVDELKSIELEKVDESKVNEHEPATKQEGEGYFRGELIKHLERMGDKLTPEEKELLVRAKKEHELDKYTPGGVPKGDTHEFGEGKVPDDKDPEATKIKKLLETFVQMGDDRFEVEHIDDGTLGTVIAINGQEYRFDQDFASMWRDEATGELSKDGLTELALDALSNMEEEEYNEVKAAGDERSDDQIEDEEAARVRDVKLDMRDDDLEDQRRERGTADESKTNEKQKLPDALKKRMFKKGKNKKDKECKESKVNEAVDVVGFLNDAGINPKKFIEHVKKVLMEAQYDGAPTDSWDNWIEWANDNFDQDDWSMEISDACRPIDPFTAGLRKYVMKEIGAAEDEQKESPEPDLEQAQIDDEHRRQRESKVDEKARCTKREKRQVKHIEKGEKTAGRSAKKAKEIAHATVNKLKSEGKVNEDKIEGLKGTRGTDLLKDLLGLA